MINSSNFQFDYVFSALPVILESLLISLNIMTVALFFGLIIGLSVAFIRIYRIRFIYPITSFYLSAIRGVPLMVQLFIFYFGLPQIFPQSINFFTPYMASCIAFSINVGAYMSETLRASIISIDKGQKEAALSVGMTEFQAMKNVVLPQAAIVAIPSLGNTLINLLKETSLVFTIGVVDMLGRAKMLAAANYRWFESFIAVALIYWVLTVIISRILTVVEKKLNKSYSF